MLARYTSSDTSTIVRNVTGHGVEAWWRLHAKYSRTTLEENNSACNVDACTRKLSKRRESSGIGDPAMGGEVRCKDPRLVENVSCVGKFDRKTWRIT